ncbi:ANTAR domain-containing protein [Actinomycetospora sp. CA-084318]|uniref:GAF and ANTAR domain-containing protein n=1 Tax=Actinomycetospora sp. CA-084318 TaxID=3239892 RepID=UPI003D99204B
MSDATDDRLVIALRGAATELLGHRSIRDLENLLGQVIASAVETIPAVDAGSISMVEQGRVETRHPTSELIGQLDDTQSELGEGPCLSAILDPPESGVVVAQDLAGDDAPRWPRFSEAVVRAGFRGLLSVQLTTQGGVRGALHLYAERPNAFDEHSRTLAGLFGVQAAVLLYGANQAHHLQRAIDSRDLIGRAKGILAERFAIDDETAFQMLVKSSQDTNLKLTAVARWVAESASARQVKPS